MIPANRISQVAKNVLAYLPVPTASGSTQNYTQSDANPLNNTVWTLRVDHSFSEKSRIFGMYSGRDNTRFTAAGRVIPLPPIRMAGIRTSSPITLAQVGTIPLLRPC